jgi:hypothetical protein
MLDQRDTYFKKIATGHETFGGVSLLGKGVSLWVIFHEIREIRVS